VEEEEKKMWQAARRKAMLITFDIDGTLLKGGENANTGHKRAIEWAVSKVWGVEATVQSVKHGGLTDPIIIQNMLRKHGKSDQEIWGKMDQALQMATEYFEKTYADNEPVTVLPGVHSLLDTLKQRGVYLAVVSGNLESIGWKKLERAQLRPYFMTGAFGSDHTSRGELIRIAKRRVFQCCGVAAADDVLSWDIYHVGDTLEDMQAAKDACVLGIGVLTGNVRQVEEFGEAHSSWPFLVLPDLTHREVLLARLGI